MQQSNHPLVGTIQNVKYAASLPPVLLQLTVLTPQLRALAKCIRPNFHVQCEHPENVHAATEQLDWQAKLFGSFTCSAYIWVMERRQSMQRHRHITANTMDTLRTHYGTSTRLLLS